MEKTPPPQEDLRKPKQPAQDGGEERKEEGRPLKGIIKLGEDAKYSEGLTEEQRRKASADLHKQLQQEQERIVEASLAEYLLNQQRLAASGQVVKVIKSLELTLKEKLRVYSKSPDHPVLWRIAKIMGDLALKHAVKNLNARQFDTAFAYLRLTQKHTEPHAGSNWSSNLEWVILRKNLHKNFALYHQKNTMWQQAFDNLKLALRFEQQLNLVHDVTNTSLTCAIIQQKMKNYGLSIEYAQQCMKNIEAQLGIKKGAALQDSRYSGKDPEKQKFNDKQMTAYSISLHILGKNLLNLGFLKEAKHFITKAHYVVTKMLLLEKKNDLQLAIQMDMKTVLEKTRYQAEVYLDEAEKRKAQSLRGKKKLVKETLTDEDIERSLATIVSGLATISEGPDSLQEKVKEVEDEVRQLADHGELQQFHEEFKDIVDQEQAKTDKQLEEIKQGVSALAEPDDQEKTPGQAKRKAGRQASQADRRETDPEYMARLEDYQRAQEQLRLKQDNFQRRQKEFEEKKARRLASKQGKLEQLEQQKSQMERDSSGQPARPERRVRERAEPSTGVQASKLNKLQRYQSDQRTKKAPLNLARIGAQHDVEGIVHVGEKGTKHFFKQRKQNILSLNRLQYDADDMQVKMSAEEYNELQRQRLQEEGELAQPKPAEPLPNLVSLSIKSDSGAAQKKQEGARSEAKKLFGPGLRSTSLVVDKVKDRVYKPPKPGSLADEKRRGPDVERLRKESEESLKKRKDAASQPLAKPRAVEEEREEDSEERAQREFDTLSAGGEVDEFKITEKGQEVLDREDRNYLVRHKTHAQLQEEDPDKGKLWGEDHHGNKVLLRADDGQPLTAEQVEAGEAEEEGAMFEGLAKLTAEIKKQGEKERKEAGRDLLETEQEAKKRREKELEEADRAMRRDFQAAAEEGTQGILKGGPRSSSKGKKQLRFALGYDQQGVETRGRGTRSTVERPGKARGRQAQGQRGSQAKAGAPSTSKERRKTKEDEEAEQLQREAREERLANEKHTAQTYYGATRRGGAGGGRTKFSQDHLDRLSKPQNKEAFKVLHEVKKQQEAGKPQPGDKQTQFAKKLQRTNQIDFEDYVDRELPHIKGDGEFSRTRKTSRGLREFDTRTGAKQGTFADLIKEEPKAGGTFAEQQKAEKMARLAVTDGRFGHRELRDTDEHLPQYMKVARQAQLEKAVPTNQARMKAFRKAMNDNLVQTMGLKNHINFGAPAYLNLKDLRELENRSAQQIQAMCRGYFARKWYLNYIVRKKLGVPFSGLEFAQNPFLRQFNKPNTNLNKLRQVDPSNFVEAVPTAADLKLSTIQIKRLRNRQYEKITGKTRMPDDTDGTRMIAKSLQKGVNPAQIIQNLQDDFLAQGLEAYDQFKRLNVGIDHDEDGRPQKRVAEAGQEVVEAIDEGHSGKVTYGVFNLPNWVGDKQDDVGGPRGRAVDTSESEQYLARKAKEKERAAKTKGTGPSLAGLLNHVVTQEPAPQKSPRHPGGGSPSRDPGGSPSGPGGGGGDLGALLRRARDPDAEDSLFQPARYQEFSREPIVFYKRVVNDQKMLRWTIRAGDAFKRRSRKEMRFFIPINLLGQVLGSHQVVLYRMNLELIKISSDLDAHLENFKFETIWPFILYLLNYWVKNQASIMLKSQMHPQRQIYQAELKRINADRGFIQFFHETPQFQEELERLQRRDDLVGEGQQDGSSANKQLPASVFGDAKQQMSHFLDFSSEIEFDERFDKDKFRDAHGAIDSVTEGQHRIDRTLPAHARPNTKVQRQKNREKLFDAYKKSVEEYEMNQKRVHFDQATLARHYEQDPGMVEKEIQQEKEQRERLAAERYAINIKEFINENFLYLPANKESSSYKLLKALQSSGYSEFEKKSGVTRKNMAHMNEERRRRLNLPPLTSIDYNCIERAAQKLKLVIDCLMLSRRMSGDALIPKDIQLTQMIKHQERRHVRHQRNALKPNRIALLIYQQWGEHIQKEPEFNPEAVQVKESLQKIQQYQQSNLFQDGSADNITEVIQQQLEAEDAQVAQQEPLRQVAYDQDLAELEREYGVGRPSVLSNFPTRFDPFTTRHKRIVNEFENYIEDKSIVSQQAIRLPVDELSGSSPLMIQTVYVRKIKSNIENILQILWEREAETRKAQGLEPLRLTGDREVDAIIMEEADDADVEEYEYDLEGPGDDPSAGKSDVRRLNEGKRKALLEKAPKIVRLQSKVCRIISDHEDVQEYDAEEYPPGTDKIHSLMVLDVEQEKLQKQHTAYKTYAQVQVCSPINRRQLWDDSVNVPWETFVQFFRIFGIDWDPIAFMKRGNFRKEEAFLANEYLSRCFFLEPNAQELTVDLGRLDFHQIKYDEIFLQLPENRSPPPSEVAPPKRGLFEKYIKNEEFIQRFDETDYDRMIFPFYDESATAFNRLFKFGRQKEYKEWIKKFQDPEEQKDVEKLNLHLEIGAMGTATPVLMVEEVALLTIKQDPAHMFNLTLRTFNNRRDDLLYMGRIHLAVPIHYSKIEAYAKQASQAFNLKVEYFVRGMVPTVLIKAFDSKTMEVLQFQTIDKRHIKMVIRICNQQSDKMIQNQLQSLISVRSSKPTVGRSLYLNFDRRHQHQKNLGQNFVNMLVCNELLLQKFVSNQEAAKNLQFNNGIKQFKGVMQNLELLGKRPFLVSVNQYDMDVETLLYYNPMAMVFGNKHISPAKVLDDVLMPLLQQNLQTKCFDRVKIWKINLVDARLGSSYDILLSLHDLVFYFESELPYKMQLDNPVKLPNLLDLLQDYLAMILSHRSLLGRILLWKVPQYQRPIDNETGRMLPVNPDELYRMKFLDIYKQMMLNIQEQMAFEDNNALPLSLNNQKKDPSKTAKQLPNLCLRCKTIREKNMPIFENNSRQVLKLFSQDMQVIIQRPKVFSAGLKKLQFVLVTVILHPSLECWIWQLYFPKNQRTFSFTIYSSDLFALDDEILNDPFVVDSDDPSTALWAHLINLSRLVKNPIGDIMIQIQNFKEPLREILFQDIVYNQNAKDMLFMEIVIKSYSNLVTDVESTFPAIHLKSDNNRGNEMENHTFAVRAYSLTKNIWVKDYQPFFEVVAMLKREKYFIQELEWFYYTMLKDTACLLSHKIIFSEQAKTHEVKKRKAVYDLDSIIGRKEIFNRVSDSIEKTGSPKKEARLDELLDEANLAVLQQEENEQSLQTRMNKIKNRQDWENVVELNRIVYQAIISQNPMQICTIIFNEVTDVFVYRLYRTVDSSVFERQIHSNDVVRTCAPHLRSMIKQGLLKQVGERVAQHYMSNILVASVVDFYKIR